MMVLIVTMMVVVDSDDDGNVCKEGILVGWVGGWPQRKLNVELHLPGPSPNMAPAGYA